MSNKYFQSKDITLAQQIYLMRAEYPRLQLERRKDAAIWTGYFNPMGMGESYLVRIVYKPSSVPKVWVISPKLQKRPGSDRIPHTYPEDRLCLYLPRAWDWHPGKSIAATIVPWISLWLCYYEVWLATGEWLGGGEHPPVAGERRKRRRSSNE